MATLTNRVQMLLEGSPGEPWSPWQLSKILNANRKSICTIVSRLRKRGIIQQYQVRGRPPMNGFYSFTPPQPTPLSNQDPPFQIHNFQIWIERPLIEMNGRTLQVIGMDILNNIKTKLPYVEIEEKRTSTYCYYNLGPNRKLTLQIAPKGSITIWTECSNNPIMINDFSLYLRFLEMLFSEFWITSNPRVRQLDFNRDYKGITINNFSNITVQDVERELIQIYNKGTDLRTEKRFFTDLKPEILAREMEKIGKPGTELVTATKLQELHDQINNLTKSNQELRKGFNETIQAVNTLVMVYSTPSVNNNRPEGYG